MRLQGESSGISAGAVPRRDGWTDIADNRQWLVQAAVIDYIRRRGSRTLGHFGILVV